LRWNELRSLATIIGGILILFSAQQCAPSSKVQTGLENLIVNYNHKIAFKRIGIVTNHTGVNIKGTQIWKLLKDLPNVDVAAVFSPEHGLFGEAAAGEKVTYSESDEELPPLYSLYGPTRKPTKEMLDGIDLLLYDIQDIGARFYTYISTMGLIMEAAAESGIPCLILDRPNPLTGKLFTGPILDLEVSSFVGLYPIPSVYGLTPGELALMIADQSWIEAVPSIEVVPLTGWSRDMWYDETGLPWVPPSPNIPNLETAIVYPGTVLIEATNVSEGRGTDHPFRWIGAPWIDSNELSDAMNIKGLPGVTFSPIEFTPHSIPGAAPDPKNNTQTCNGVEIILTNRNIFSPVTVGIQLLHSIALLYPQKLEIKEAGLNRLFGSDRLSKSLGNSDAVNQLVVEIKKESDHFRESAKQYHLYKN
jgi:uncharacterized protein YbbC (DUF1343 family)|tara:strand:+ start:735 stop:1991 length:1257 start_codon:yes stop_codon:yes gene_type:complete